MMNVSIDAGTRQAESLVLIAKAMEMQADAMVRAAAAAERQVVASERQAATLDAILHTIRNGGHHMAHADMEEVIVVDVNADVR